MGILHVKSATHNANAGTVGVKDSPSNPYGLSGALASVVAGDHIWVWGDGDYLIGSQLAATVAGTVSSPIALLGRSASGDPPTARAVWRATAAVPMLHLANTAPHYIVSDIDFDAANTATWCVEQASTGATNWTWLSCLLRRSSGSGILLRGASHVFSKCVICDHASHGLIPSASSTPAGNVIFTDCVVTGNGLTGMTIGGGNHHIVRSRFYANGTIGLHVSVTGSAFVSVWHSVCHGNGSHGMSVPSAEFIGVLLNNVFANNAGYQLHAPLSSLLRPALIRGNLANAAGSGVTDMAGAWADYGIVGDPLFVDPAAGNFAPQSASPLIRAGYGDRTIGVLEPAGGSGPSRPRVRVW